MLLQLENTSREKIDMLLNFAKENQLELKLIDDNATNYFLPGKPLTDEELLNLVKKSRQSGNLSLEDAHHFIRSSFHAD